MFLLAALFFVLSPGVFLTLPAGSKGVWMSGQTSVAAAIVHALVFILVLHFFGRQWRLLQGFATSVVASGCTTAKPFRCSKTVNKKTTTYCNSAKCPT